MKYDIPKFKHAFEKLFERSKFLNGKYYTFFAPGQLRDDRWIIPDVNPITQEYLGYHVDKEWTYIKPTDWLVEGSPLFPPQVIRININVYGAYFNADAPFASLVIGDPHWSNPEIIPYTFFYEPATAEHKRLLKIATSAKKIIEKLRKGRTWVDIEDFYDGSVERGGLCPPLDVDDGFDLCNDILNPSRLNGFNFGDLRNVGLFLDIPNPDLDFFGTDFLGIYLGDHIFTPISFGDNLLFSNFNVQPKWLAMQDVVSKTYKKFIKYSEMLFPCDIGTDIFAASQRSVANIIAQFDGEANAFDVMDHVTINDLSELPDNYITYYPLPDGGYNVYTSTGLTQTDYQVIYKAFPITPTISNFTKVRQWAKDNKIDIISPGKTLTISDAEYLVTLIANHYNFNPQTGKDIKS